MNDNIETQFKKLRRSRNDKMIAGVCGGAADMLKIDPVLLRLGFVALTLLGFGAGVILYLVAWIIVPEQD